MGLDSSPYAPVISASGLGLNIAASERTDFAVHCGVVILVHMFKVGFVSDADQGFLP